MDGWMDGWVDRWTDGRMDGWVDGWMGGWMDGWIGGALNGHRHKDNRPYFAERSCDNHMTITQLAWLTLYRQ